MARAMGRSVSTERLSFLKRETRRFQAEQSAADVKAARYTRARRAGLVAMEVILIALFGLGIGASTLHVVKPDASCASCSAEISAK